MESVAVSRHLRSPLSDLAACQAIKLKGDILFGRGVVNFGISHLFCFRLELITAYTQYRKMKGRFR